MALSMEEQRILAEIEDELSRTEPVLAVASVIALFLLTVVPVLVYALVTLHVTQAQPQVHPSAPSAPHAATSVPR